MNDRVPPMDLTIADLKSQIRNEARRVTSYDVALAAGVSQSAVSRCFKPGASVSKATFERVMKAATELDYIPNAAARSLMTRRSNLVAVIISSHVNLSYPEVLSELSKQFGRRGMRILLFSLENEGEVGSVMADVWKHQVDGAVVGARLTAAQAAEFERRQVPFVLFNRSLPMEAVNAVLCDQRDAARVLVSRLASAGHKTFAMIDGPFDSSVAAERKRGVTERLAELGLAAPLVVNGGHDYASGGHGLREIVVRLGRVPDAVICVSDVVAIGCLDTARLEMKLDVPGQLSVAGFGGIAQSSWLNYNLTTLRQPLQPMIVAVADMLGALIEGVATESQRKLFPVTVIDGATARLGPHA